MKLGGYVTQGLANGIGDGAAEPVRRIGGLSRQLTRALAVGVATPMVATAVAASPGVGIAAQGASSARGGDSYEVHFHPAPGMDERRLFDMFERWHERKESSRSAAGRSSYLDTPDWG
jgi:hypothetical protein